MKFRASLGGAWRCMGQIRQAPWSMHVQHSVRQRRLSMPTRAIMHGDWECSHEGPATNGLKGNSGAGGGQS